MFLLKPPVVSLSVWILLMCSLILMQEGFLHVIQLAVDGAPLSHWSASPSTGWRPIIVRVEVGKTVWVFLVLPTLTEISWKKKQQLSVLTMKKKRITSRTTEMKKKGRFCCCQHSHLCHWPSFCWNYREHHWMRLLRLRESAYQAASLCILSCRSASEHCQFTFSNGKNQQRAHYEGTDVLLGVELNRLAASETRTWGIWIWDNAVSMGKGVWRTNQPAEWTRIRQAERGEERFYWKPKH